MKSTLCRSVVVGLFLVGALVLMLSGCFGGGGEPAATTMSLVPVEGTSPTTTSTEFMDGTTVEDDALSTFTAKDPFIQQAVATTTSTTVARTTTTKSGTTTTKASTTTTKSGTTTTKATTTTTKATTTTTKPPSTTTTQSTTTTTSGYLHTMTVVSISTVGGSPAVTFRVDGQTYSNKVVGDVVSTTWGEVQVLAIDVVGQVATFMHGSEPVTLAVGDSIHE